MKFNLKDKLPKISLTEGRAGQSIMLVLAVCAFVAGYNIMLSEQGACYAQVNVPPAPPVVVIGGPCVIPCCPTCGVVPCEPTNTASTARDIIWQPFEQTLKEITNQIPPYMATPRGNPVGTPFASGYGLEGFLDGIVDAMLFALMDRLNDIELGYMEWFSTFWYYNFKPALMDMTDQVNASTTDHNRTYQAQMDSYDMNRTNGALGGNDMEQQDARTFRVSENGACIGGGTSGGSQRAYNLSREMRKAMQEETIAEGTNRRGTPSAKGRGETKRIKSVEYEEIFCDPTDNNGVNNCNVTGPPRPDLVNADVKVSSTLYGNLTIPVHDTTAAGTVGGNAVTVGDKYEKATKALVDNLTGEPVNEPISQEAMRSAQAHQEFVERRSYLARMNAIRSVPRLGLSWRAPGTKLAQWVSEIRQEAGVPAGEISDNPSYKEVLHAVSVDRFNSGKYANAMLTDDSDLEMEKLTISSFYLMQLRDYYELLERMGLTLAVQISMMADTVPLTPPAADAPRR